MSGLPAAPADGLSCGLGTVVLGPIGAAAGCIDTVKNLPGAVAQSGFEGMARSLGEGYAAVLKLVMTFWTHVDLSSGLDLGAGGVVDLLRQLSWWLVLLTATVGAIVAGVKVACSRDMREGQLLVQGLVRVVVVAGGGAALISALAAGSDATSTWILDRASASTGGYEQLGAIAVALETTAPGVVFIVAIIGLLTALGQVLLLVFRAAFVTLVAGVLPWAAAASLLRSGSEWFNRLCAYTLAVLLYKPVAALVYAAAFKMMSGSGSGSGSDSGAGTLGVIQGLALVVMAVVALPALMRLLVPAVGAVASSGGGGMVMAAAAAGAGMLGQGAQVLQGSGGGAGQSPQGPPQPGPAAASTPSGASSPGRQELRLIPARPSRREGLFHALTCSDVSEHRRQG